MKKNILKQLVLEQKTTREMGEILGSSQTNVRYWLKKYSLSTKIKGYCCKYCGEVKKENMMNKGGGRKARTVCKKCHCINSKKRIKTNRQEVIKYKGGKCQICGYNKYIGALEFHHRDPKNKDPNWTYMRHWHLDKIKKEVDKCDCLCSNCHREIHADPEDL
jgi:hypothetical protein